jgi:glycosyltransferase involved in cell wall biosynthesis
VRILAWHVHGSWMTAFVQGPHEYLVPVVPDRGPDGRGRARTWDWPATVREVTPDELRRTEFDVVVLQRPHELELVERWTGRRPGVDVPAVYVEHNTPTGHAVSTRHVLADRDDVPLVHVTHFNRVVWDGGRAPATVIEHGVPDPGPLYRGDRASLAVVVNEPVRRRRVAGTDLVADLAADPRAGLPIDVYGMGMAALVAEVPALAGRTHEDLPQHRLHAALARHRAYLHPYRWTSLGLALLEAMTIGMPVLCLSVTEAPEAVPPQAGLVTNDLTAIATTARRWLHEPDLAAEAGRHARQHALSRYGLSRFQDDWAALLKEVVR